MQNYQVPVPEWAKNSVIYEVNLRQYTEAGTFKAFEPHLSRLRNLGFDVLWFMPIYPIGAKNRKGSKGSYYSIRDFKNVNPEHGSLADFKSLVKHAHKLGMRVMLDWVANHSSWDNELIFRYPHWYTRNRCNNVIVPEGTDWLDVADLNYENHDLWNYKIEAMRFWIEQVGIDGFRCDVAGMVPSAFWDEVYQNLIKVKPDLFMLAEWDEPELHEKAFHMSYAWEVHKVFNAIWKGEKRVADLTAELEKDSQRYLPSAIRMHFTSNHDENSWNGSEFERLGESRLCFAALSYLLPGMPLVYSGQEAGNEKRLSFFDSDSIIWKDDEASNLYSLLNQWKHTYPALFNGGYGGSWRVVNVKDSEVFIIERLKDQNRVFGIFNLQPLHTSFEIPPELTGSFLELDGQSTKLGGIVEMEAWGYRIFTNMP